MNRPYIIKVCGLCEGMNIKQVASLGIDWAGMIFYAPSPRCMRLSPEQLALDTEPEALPTGVKRVGVFVDEQPATIVRCVERYALGAVQLHGHESPSLLRQLRAMLPPGTLLLKAIGMSTQADLLLCHDYDDTANYLLFDTKCASTGGSGKHFPWQLLQTYQGPLPFLLSGGIGPDDAPAIRSFSHPLCAGIDLNSRFEQRPGLKDIEKLKNFISQL